MSFIIIYITHESEAAAQTLTDALLEQKLIACANTFPMTSAYWWQGAIQNDAEWVSIVKTKTALWETVRDKIEALHPYEVPCIMKIKAEANDAYEKWINDSTILMSYG